MLKYLWVFFISMVPVVELRVAIPVGVGMGLELIPTYIVAIIGNMLPVPVIYLFARKVLEWGQDKKYIGRPFTWILEKGAKAGAAIQKNGSKGLFIGLLLFVAIPLPGTGAWTGTLAASILNMKFRPAVAAVMCGVLTAGVIMLLGSAGVFSGISALFG